MTLPIFRPSRQFRREQTGKHCPACGTRMHWQDVVALRGEESLTFLHLQCAEDIAREAELAHTAEVVADAATENFLDAES